MRPSRGNMPVPLRWAMPCADVPLSALYTRTRKSPDEGGILFIRLDTNDKTR